MRLEDIAATARLGGIMPGRAMTVLAAQMRGANAVEVTYLDDNGALGQVVLFREDEAKIALHLESGRPFDADPRNFRLAAEAQRILLAGLHDPMLAVATSDVQPLPHQIRAVYGELLPPNAAAVSACRRPRRGQDDHGRALHQGADPSGRRAHLSCDGPGALVEQWHAELALKFGLEFEILAPGAEDTAPGKSVFEQKRLLIARMDQLARDEVLLEQIERPEFDLVVVDEAHRMSASWFSGELKASKRFQLGELLSDRARHFLLMTATPHNGKDEPISNASHASSVRKWINPAHVVTTAAVVDRSRESHALYVELTLQDLNLSRHWLANGTDTELLPPGMPSRWRAATIGSG